jgi:hypothetical protein
MRTNSQTPALFALTLALAAATSAVASSHREAPLITSTPKVDCSDFYLFRSYESGRSNYVTLIANYLPLQDAYGGPNYFQLDPNALYEIHVDNNGDAIEDLTFQFRFFNTSRGFRLPVGTPGNQVTNSIPLLAAGQITAASNAALLVDQTYSLNLISGPRRSGSALALTNTATGPVFTKPQDFVGEKTFPDYNAYANQYIYDLPLPGTTNLGRVFVGQRKDPFVVNLGETFDLINISTSPVGPEDANKDSLLYKNVTALILEVPIDFIRGQASNTIIGSWSTASLVAGGQTNQVSRLSMPLVNEVVIGVDDKDRFNASEPKDDLANFANYVTHPTLPALIEILFRDATGGLVVAPTLFPRTDLVAAFVTGITGLNANGAVGEMARLNLTIPPTARADQNNMGVIGGDNAGFPNGRRLGDDVVDIELRVAMGKLIQLGLFGQTNQALAGGLPFTDGATVNARMFPDRFPYVNPPVKGSPNDPTITITPRVSAGAAGPYRAVGGTFDPTNRILTVTAPEGATGFLGATADGKVSFGVPEVRDGQIRTRVQ